LLHIESTWNLILDGDHNLKCHLDANTVRLLQTRCPVLSSADYSTVWDDMQNGSLFPAVTDIATRQGIWNRLGAITYIIPSLYTFLEDTKYLEPCAKIMKSLLPAKFGGSIRQAFRQQHNGQTHCQIQTAEHTSSTLTLTLDDCIWQAYLQLWLFEMRHFPEMVGISPRKDDGRPKPTVQRPDDNLWHRIGCLARGGGFESTAIQHFAGRDPDAKMASEFLSQCRPMEHYKFDEMTFSNEVQRIVTTLRGVQARSVPLTAPLLSFDGHSDMDLADRCGRPFEQSFLDDKKYLFARYIYHKPQQLEDLVSLRQRHLTSFKVKQDIFHAFFGHNLGTSSAQQGPGRPPSSGDVMTGVESTDRTEPAHHLQGSTQPLTGFRPSENVETTSVQNTAAARLASTSEMGTQTSQEPMQIDAVPTVTAAPSPPMVPDIMPIDSTSPETTQEVTAPQDQSQDLVPIPQRMEIDASEGTERTMPGSFSPTVQPLYDNTDAGTQVLPKDKSVKDLLKSWGRSLYLSKPVLIYRVDTREYMYIKPEWMMFRDWYKEFNKETPIQTLAIDQNEVLMYERGTECFKAAMNPSSPFPRVLLIELRDHKTAIRRTLANLDSTVTHRVQAIEWQGRAFTEHRG